MGAQPSTYGSFPRFIPASMEEEQDHKGGTAEPKLDEMIVEDADG